MHIYIEFSRFGKLSPKHNYNFCPNEFIYYFNKDVFSAIFDIQNTAFVSLSPTKLS
jgi:hypothetical protein